MSNRLETLLGKLVGKSSRGGELLGFSQAAKIYSEYRQRGVSQKIAPGDHMYHGGGQNWYFSTGESGLAACLHAVSQSWCGGVNRILDIPCGHGRVARHLRAAHPNAEMFFCEIDKSGADFCANAFRGTAIYSKPEMTEVALPKDLDLIWVGSLFTHVDEDRTSRWLAYLASHLSPNGVLVSTFHGLYSAIEQGIRPMIDPAVWGTITEGVKLRGYGYAPYSNFELGDYGISLTTPQKIMEMACAVPGTRIISYVERGWADNHDVLGITRNDRTLAM